MPLAFGFGEFTFWLVFGVELLALTFGWATGVPFVHEIASMANKINRNKRILMSFDKLRDYFFSATSIACRNASAVR